MKASLDYKDGVVRAVFDDKLPSSLSSQLHFWGLRRTESATEWIANADGSHTSLLPKLKEFLDEEGLEVSCSDRALELLQSEAHRSAGIARTLEHGLAAKEGRFPPESLSAILDVAKTDLRRSLRDHQIKAALHLSVVENGANFSVPGSGKSTVVLTVYQLLRNRGKVNRLFVIGPPSCFGPWKKEFLETLGRDGNPRVLAGLESSSRRPEYYRSHGTERELFLTTYQSFSNDVADIKNFFGHPSNKAMMVVDEAHYCKQRGGVWADAILDVSPLAVCRCVLTGTPMPNGYEDVFNLFDALWGVNSVLSQEDKFKILQAKEIDDVETAKRILDLKVGPLFYRVRKRDLGLSEQVFYPPVIIPMNMGERTLYQAIVARIGVLEQGQYLREAEVIRRLKRGRLTRIRQCLSYARMLANAVEDYDEDLLGGSSDLYKLIMDYDSREIPAKAERLVELVSKLTASGEKVVIWANFVDTLRLLSRLLLAKNIPNKMIYGAVPTEQDATEDEDSREKIRDEFVDSKSGLNVLLANPAACAESISLHKTCQHAIYYDLSFNAAQYLQSLDRIHRVGGSENKSAYYHFLQYENTIDRDIKHALDLKAQRMALIVDDDYPIYSLNMFEDTIDDGIYRRILNVGNGTDS